MVALRKASPVRSAHMNFPTSPRPNSARLPSTPTRTVGSALLVGGPSSASRGRPAQYRRFQKQ
jgi:hypothetical protein